MGQKKQNSKNFIRTEISQLRKTMDDYRAKAPFHAHFGKKYLPNYR